MSSTTEGNATLQLFTENGVKYLMNYNLYAGVLYITAVTMDIFMFSIAFLCVPPHNVPESSQPPRFSALHEGSKKSSFDRAHVLFMLSRDLIRNGTEKQNLVKLLLQVDNCIIKFSVFNPNL